MARTMRCAIVGSGTRNARAISSVVRPPSSRSVSATRASVESTGWQAMKISRSRSSPIVVVERRVEVRRRDRLLAASSSRAELLVLALEQLRCGAAGRSPRCLRRRHQPGARVVRDARLGPLLERGDQRVLRQVLGQADVAHDRARGRRSAGRTRSARPPRSRAARRPTRRHSRLLAPRSAARSRSSCSRSSGVNASPKSSASKTWRISISALADRVRAALDPLDRLVHRRDLPDPVAGDQLLGLGERAVDHGRCRRRSATRAPLRARVQPLAGQHDAGLDQLLVELAHRGEQLRVGHHARSAVLVALTSTMTRIVSPSDWGSLHRRRTGPRNRHAGEIFFQAGR